MILCYTKLNMLLNGHVKVMFEAYFVTFQMTFMHYAQYLVISRTGFLIRKKSYVETA